MLLTSSASWATRGIQPVVTRLIGPERPKSATPPVRSYPRYRAKFRPRLESRPVPGSGIITKRTCVAPQAEFGVSPEVILGILGVETAFGQNTGSFRVVDSLATIAFDGPRRQEYFRDELKELLLMARDLSIDPLTIKGSYAGAMGLPQFMPSSVRKYAVDFDGDGVIDLGRQHLRCDRQHRQLPQVVRLGRWRSGTGAGAVAQQAAAAELVTGLERTHDVEALKEKGVEFSTQALPEGVCSVVELPTPGKPSKYMAGFGNFRSHHSLQPFDVLRHRRAGPRQRDSRGPVRTSPRAIESLMWNLLAEVNAAVVDDDVGLRT